MLRGSFLYLKNKPPSMNKDKPSDNNAVLRNWCFTSYSDYIAFNEKHHSVIKYCVWQREKCPETGRLHFQGYIELNKAIRFTGLKKIIGECHVEPRKGTRDQARAYCMKEDTRVDGPWEFPNPEAFDSKQGKRNDLNEIAVSIKENGLTSTISSYPDMFVKYHKGMTALAAHELRQKVPKWRDLTVSVFWGEANSGKTRRAFDLAGDSWFKLDFAKDVWWDGYLGEESIIIDDFYGWIPYTQLLNILDGYPIRLQVKGGFTYACYTKVFITSNKHPSTWYPQIGLSPALERRLHNITEFTAPKIVAKNVAVAEVGGNTVAPTSDTPAVSLTLSELGNFLSSLKSEDTKKIKSLPNLKPVPKQNTTAKQIKK